VENHKDPEVLEELYTNQGMTQQEIADKFGVSRPTISKYISKNGIEYPDKSRSKSEDRTGEPCSFMHNDYGYESWRHYYKGDRRLVFVHRLAAVAWFGLEEVNGNVVHHKNGCRFDNRESNLETMSNSEHARHHANE
jgi:hypothetical protein